METKDWKSLGRRNLCQRRIMQPLLVDKVYCTASKTLLQNVLQCELGCYYKYSIYVYILQILATYERSF